MGLPIKFKINNKPVYFQFFPTPNRYSVRRAGVCYDSNSTTALYSYWHSSWYWTGAFSSSVHYLNHRVTGNAFKEGRNVACILMGQVWWDNYYIILFTSYKKPYILFYLKKLENKLLNYWHLCILKCTQACLTIRNKASIYLTCVYKFNSHSHTTVNIERKYTFQIPYHIYKCMYTCTYIWATILFITNKSNNTPQHKTFNTRRYADWQTQTSQ